MTAPSPPSPSDLPSSYLNEYSGGQLIGTSLAFMIMSCAIVILRFYTRITASGVKLGLDDYMVGPALFSNIVLDISCLVFVNSGGVGYHVEYWEIHDPNMINTWAKVILAVELTYFLAVCTSKLTILAMYVRNFPSKPILYVTYTLIGIVVGAWFGSTMTAIFQSTPVGCQWDPNAPSCYSIDILAYFRYVSLPTILTDVAMLFLPMPMVWGLNLRRSQKLAVTGVFLTGSIGVIASCVRFAKFYETDALSDPTWKSASLNVWTVVEPGTYLIASCLPPLRPLFTSAARRLPFTGSRSTREDTEITLASRGTRPGKPVIN